MTITTIPAERLMYFQRALRMLGAVLIRARPYRDSEGNDCYHVMYMGGR